MVPPSITQERLRELLHYDAATGIFTWIKRPSNCVKIGEQAGCYDDKGYIHIRADDRLYLAHRLAWFYETGSWPITGLDHKNGNPSDNRIDNLREATQSQNVQNIRGAKRDSSHGYLGVKFMPKQGKKPWMARIQVNRKNIFLGYYHTGEEAHAAYIAAKRKLHPFGELGKRSGLLFYSSLSLHTAGTKTSHGLSSLSLKCLPRNSPATAPGAPAKPAPIAAPAAGNVPAVALLIKLG